LFEIFLDFLKAVKEALLTGLVLSTVIVQGEQEEGQAELEGNSREITGRSRGQETFEVLRISQGRRLGIRFAFQLGRAQQGLEELELQRSVGRVSTRQ